MEGYTVYISGQIGSGKTTIIKKILKEIPNSSAIKTPEDFSPGLLKILYDENKKENITSQKIIEFGLNCYENQLICFKERVRILERTPLEEVEVFARLWLQHGRITQNSFDNYKEIATKMMRKFGLTGLSLEEARCLSVPFLDNRDAANEVKRIIEEDLAAGIKQRVIFLRHHDVHDQFEWLRAKNSSMDESKGFSRYIHPDIYKANMIYETLIDQGKYFKK